MSIGKTLYTPKQIHELTGLPLKRTYELFHQKTFPRIRIGNRYYISADAFHKWLEDYEGKRFYI